MRDPQRRDWDATGRALLAAAAAALAEAAGARAGALSGAIETRLHGDHHAVISTQAPDLVRRAQGAPGRPPEAFMAPTAADLAEARARMIRILQQDSA